MVTTDYEVLPIGGERYCHAVLMSEMRKHCDEKPGLRTSHEGAYVLYNQVHVRSWS
jgi:hypothetical protein